MERISDVELLKSIIRHRQMLGKLLRMASKAIDVGDDSRAADIMIEMMVVRQALDQRVRVREMQKRLDSENH